MQEGFARLPRRPRTGDNCQRAPGGNRNTGSARISSALCATSKNGFTVGKPDCLAVQRHCRGNGFIPICNHHSPPSGFGYGETARPCQLQARDVRLHLIRKVFHKAFGHQRRRRAQSARAGRDHGLADIMDLRPPWSDLPGAAVTIKPLGQPASPDAARKTLAAGLVCKKGHRSVGNLDHVPPGVEDDDAAGAQKRPETAEAGFVERGFQRFTRDEPSGQPRHGDRLDVPAPWCAAAPVIQQGLQRQAEWHLVIPRLRNIARQTDDFGARMSVQPECPVPSRTFPEDLWHGNQRFNIVHRRGHILEPVGYGIGRAVSRERVFSLQAVEQRPLFSAHIRPSPAPKMHPKFEVSPQNAIAEQSGGLGFSHGAFPGRSTSADIRTGDR